MMDVGGLAVALDMQVLSRGWEIGVAQGAGRTAFDAQWCRVCSGRGSVGGSGD